MGQIKKVKHETITAAQHAVMEEIKMLNKDAESYDYMYTSAAFATVVIRPLMIKHGISRTKIKSENKGRYHNGVGVDAHYIFRYALVGAEELIPHVTYIDVEVDASGKVGKSGDKSMYAASTTGAKYANLDFFDLPMVEDVESWEEATELLEEQYNENGSTKEEAPKKKSKKKKKKKVTEPEPDEEETEEAEETVSASSSDYNYSDGVFDLIEGVYDEGGIEAVLEFTAGDTRVKVEELVEKLKNESDYEDEEEYEDESEEEYEDEETDEEEEVEGDEVDLNELDYDDPEVRNAVLEQLDLEDDELISACIDGFEDADQLTSFYTLCVEHANEIGQEFGEAFNEEHFDHLQEVFEELSPE